ncbi:fructose-specific PTS transporter subunit EIIC [Moraxella sp. ZY210820]|uniref:fructose-specific PTS transporter subunit EIIC n=1 Tax=unclassified Moraxella TaxID=2685852 RepID=UPI00272F1602|nr:fructose-specific PTS transporter subunit EIIC [Moraxella sp. ZY210820]WLF84657.1 fructose-specific PTS transporter subunit EIIC [Moraxella sp. ZY210820]
MTQHLVLIANYPTSDIKNHIDSLIVIQKLAHFAEQKGYVSQCYSVDELPTILPTDSILLFVGEEINHSLKARYADYPQAYFSLAQARDDSEQVIDFALRQEKIKPTFVDELTTAEAQKPLRFVAITACPTGVAHTFMAADALKQGAEKLGYIIDVETQGSVGAKNILTDEAIAQADFVILATDIEVNRERFVGKKIYHCSTGFALKQTEQAFAQAIATAQSSSNKTNNQHSNSQTSSKTKEKTGIYKHLMTGVSFMLPIVVAGGLLIALSFVFGIEAFKEQGSLADVLMQTGKATFTLMVPILSGYIAYSIADRPGLAAGLIGGLLSAQMGAGFLGAIVSGFIAGYSALLIAKKFPLPQSMQALKPILIIPLISSLIVGLLMFYVVGEPVKQLFEMMENFLNNMGTQNAIVMGLILGAMMCVDMGGPINKAAYTFSVGLLTMENANQFPIAAAMAGGMVPAIGMAVATWLARYKFTEDERNAGNASFVLGLCFISEGAIPFAAKDPMRVIPSCIIGGAVTGALVAFFHITLAAPHGGVFVLLIPNAVNHIGAYLIAIACGSVLTGVMYALLKRREIN